MAVSARSGEPAYPMARPAPNRTMMVIVMAEVNHVEARVRILSHSARTALMKVCLPAIRGRAGQIEASNAR